MPPISTTTDVFTALVEPRRRAIIDLLATKGALAAGAIDPKILTDLVGDPDPIKAAKAMKAMMTMTKIDGDAIRKAAGE